MTAEEMIPVDEFCIHHHIGINFIHSVRESGLIEMTSREERLFVPISQLAQLERLVRLYYEMDINIEGIETITYLLQRMNDMQQEILRLSNKLSVYET
jgi:hypothetical protein